MTAHYAPQNLKTGGTEKRFNGGNITDEHLSKDSNKPGASASLDLLPYLQCRVLSIVSGVLYKGHTPSAA